MGLLLLVTSNFAPLGTTGKRGGNTQRDISCFRGDDCANEPRS